jgi:hypothetical protein
MQANHQIPNQYRQQQSITTISQQPTVNGMCSFFTGITTGGAIAQHAAAAQCGAAEI